MTLPVRLEVKLQAKLNLPRIARGNELPKRSSGIDQTLNAVVNRIAWQSIGNRLRDIREDGPVEDVKELGAELQLVPLAEVEVLRQIHIREELTWEAERRPRRVADLSGQRIAKRKRIEAVWDTAVWIRRNIRQRIAN